MHPGRQLRSTVRSASSCGLHARSSRQTGCLIAQWSSTGLAHHPPTESAKSSTRALCWRPDRTPGHPADSCSPGLVSKKKKAIAAIRSQHAVGGRAKLNATSRLVAASWKRLGDDALQTGRPVGRCRRTPSPMNSGQQKGEGPSCTSSQVFTVVSSCLFSELRAPPAIRPPRRASRVAHQRICPRGFQMAGKLKPPRVMQPTLPQPRRSRGPLEKASWPRCYENSSARPGIE